MKSRRQALKLCLDTAVVVIVKIFDELLFEVFHRIKFLQIEQFAFEQTKEVFYHSIVQTITFPAHALPHAFLTKHPLVLFMLVLPALVRMKDQTGSIRYFSKSLVQHGCYHAQNRPVRDRIADRSLLCRSRMGVEHRALPHVRVSRQRDYLIVRRLLPDLKPRIHRPDPDRAVCQTHLRTSRYDVRTRISAQSSERMAITAPRIRKAEKSPPGLLPRHSTYVFSIRPISKSLRRMLPVDCSRLTTAC